MGINCLIQIGNSDDRLSQNDWAGFVREVRTLLIEEWRDRSQVHGEWFSLPDQQWQNANWSVEVLPPAWWREAAARAGQAHPDRPTCYSDPNDSPSAIHMRDLEMSRSRMLLKAQVKQLCYRWRQDSFAWTEAPVEIVETGWTPPLTDNRSVRQGGPSSRERALREQDRWVRRAQEEGWLPDLGIRVDSQGETTVPQGGIPFPVGPYATLADFQQIRGATDSRRWATTEQELASIRGAAEGSTPTTPAPASTGEDDPELVLPIVNPEFVRHPETAVRIAQLRERSNERKGNGDA